jgi:hypothetical protein
MSSAVALSAIRARVRKEADAGPDTTTGRHTNAEINSMINRSWQDLRAFVCANCGGLAEAYLKATTPTTMTAGPLSGYSFGTIPLPADCAEVHGIDVVVTANDVRSLEPCSWKDRNIYRDMWGNGTGIPIGFSIYNIGTEVTSTITAGVIAILPAPDRAYTYSIWYVPAWVDRTSDTDVFDGVAGWENWVVWDCVIKIAAPDDDKQNCAQIAMNERERAEKLIKEAAAKLQRVAPVRRIDMAARDRGTRGMWGMRRFP